MFKSTFLAIVYATSAAYAKSSIEITKPTSGEFLQRGGTYPVEVRSSGTTETSNSKTQFALCQVITGKPPCFDPPRHVVLNDSYYPPNKTFNITIPADQGAGVNLLTAGFITESGLFDETYIIVYLGNKI